MMRKSVFCAVVVVCLAVSVSVAATEEKPLAKLVVWMGSTSRALASNAVRIPVTFAGEQLPSVRVRQVTVGGSEVNPTAFDVKVERNGEEELLVVAPNANDTRAAGEYVVHLRLTPAAADAGTKVAKETVDVTLTLERAQAVKDRAKLQFISPLSVTRVVRVPYLFTAVHPTDLVIAETGGKTGVAFEPGEVDGEIRSKSTNNLGRLHAAFPRLTANGQDKVKLTLDGTAPWIGDADARILVSAPTVSTTPVAMKIAVHSRLSYFWLIALITLGIAGGQWVKTGLEARGELLNAQLAAENERQRILALESAIQDLAVRDELRQQRERLTPVMSRRRIPKAEVDARVKEVDDEVKKIVAATEALRAAAGKKLDELRAAIGRAKEQDGSLASIVRSASDVLNAQEALLKAGQITNPRGELARLEEALPDDVREALNTWTPLLRYSLKRFGKWPGTEFDATVTRLGADIGAITIPRTLGDVTKTLEETARITTELRHSIATVGMDELKALVDAAREQLLLRKDAAQHQAEIGALVRAATHLHHFDLPRELDVAAQAVEEARHAMDAAAKIQPEPAPAAKTNQAATDMATFPMSTRSGDAQETTFAPFEDAARSVEDELQHEIDLVNRTRDAVYGLLIVIAGVIIFRNAFLGTLEDLFGAFLWGFSVNLSATTLSQYAAPLIARRPFR